MSSAQSLDRSIETRLAQLRQEFESGSQILQQMQSKQSRLTESLLRIRGAIQVLEEILARSPETQNDTPLVTDSSPVD